MKTLLILVLLVGLLAAAFFTRPSQADFKRYLTGQLQAGGGRQTSDVKQDLRGLANNISADAYLRTVTYHDDYLWTTVSQGDKPQYVGAFSHWFKRKSAS